MDKENQKSTENGWMKIKSCKFLYLLMTLQNLYKSSFIRLTLEKFLTFNAEPVLDANNGRIECTTKRNGWSEERQCDAGGHVDRRRGMDFTYRASCSGAHRTGASRRVDNEANTVH